MKKRVVIKYVVECFVALLFIGLVTVTLLGAYGFQYDRLKQTLVKKTIVDIDVQHEQLKEDVWVAFDGEFITDVLPYKIFDVSPGKHNIEIAKEGYLTYKHEFVALSDVVSRFPNIYLFPGDFWSFVDEVLPGEKPKYERNELDLMVEAELEESCDVLLVLGIDGAISCDIWEKGIEFDGDRRDLLFTDGFSVNVYDYSEQEELLLSRVSHPLKAVQWYKGEHVLLYYEDLSVEVCDRTWEHCYSLVTLSDGQKLIYLSEIDKFALLEEDSLVLYDF